MTSMETVGSQFLMSSDLLKDLLLLTAFDEEEVGRLQAAVQVQN